MFSSTTALRYFKKEALAEMTPIFLLKEDEQPMATEPIYFSSDNSKYSTPKTTPDHHHESFHPDHFKQLIATQLEQRSIMGTETAFYPPTLNMSMISDHEVQSILTPIIGNHEQHTSHIPQRQNNPIQVCQFLQPVPDTTKSPAPEN